MDIQKEREAFEEVFPCSTGTVLNEHGHYESQINRQDAIIQNISWVVWQAAKASASENLKQVINNLNNIKASEFRPHHYDYDKGWRDCAVTVLNDLKAQEPANDK